MSSSSNHPKASKDRHLKVNGRDRQARIPTSCAEQIFKLSKSLGHRNTGQTIEWLLRQAEPAVTLALSNPVNVPVTPPVGASNPPPPQPEPAAAVYGLGTLSFDFEADDFISFPPFS